MAYIMEFALHPGAYFYLECLIVDRNTGLPMPVTGNTHAIRTPLFARNSYNDDWWGAACFPGQTLASDATGEITYPAPGVISIAIPASRFTWWHSVGFRRRRWSVPFEFVAISPPAPAILTQPLPDLAPGIPAPPPDPPYPYVPDFTCLIASGTITFGERHMAAPRIQLDAYPLYPNLVSPPPILPSQFLQALAALIPNSNEALTEAISASPDNVNRIIFTRSQEAGQGSPFENLVVSSLISTPYAISPTRLSQIRVLAASITP